MYQTITRGRDTIAAVQVRAAHLLPSNVAGDDALIEANGQTTEVATWQPGKNDMNGQGIVRLPRTERVVVVWSHTSWENLVEELYGQDEPIRDTAAEPKVGDRVRVVDDWHGGDIYVADGLEGVLEYISPVLDSTLPYEVRLDGDEMVTTVAKVERV